MSQLTAQECITQVALYTRVMKKYGYDRKNHKYGIGIVLNPQEREPENRKEYEERMGGKQLNINQLYKLYNMSLMKTELRTMKGNEGMLYDMIDAKHVDYPKRAPYQSRTIEVGKYDLFNSKYSIDMDYLDSLDGDDKENYIKQSFLNHYLFLGTAFDGNIYSDKVQEFLKIKPFFNFEVPEVEEVGLSWPILDDYDEKGVIDDNDYLDIKKFLKVDDDTILLCMVGDPNPDYPEYYEPEPEFIFPISRSYLKTLYNPLNQNGSYKEDFTSFAYRCAKDIEGIDDDLTFNVTMNQLYLLSPYFRITGGPQELYINTRDAMMMMYSKHKVFALRKEKDIPINAGLNVVNVGRSMNVFNQYVNVVSADHCQGGSNKPVYRVFMANIDEYTEVEREEEVRTEAITKEQLYERHPEVKDILEKTQRCKDPKLIIDGNDLVQELEDNGIWEGMLTPESYPKLQRIYEKKVKLSKIMKLNIPQGAKIRAQQEVESIEIKDLTEEDIKNCAVDDLYNTLKYYFDFQRIINELEEEEGMKFFEGKQELYNTKNFIIPEAKLREFAEGFYDDFDTYEKKFEEYVDKEVPQVAIDVIFHIDDVYGDLQLELKKYGKLKTGGYPDYFRNVMIDYIIDIKSASDEAEAERLLNMMLLESDDLEDFAKKFILNVGDSEMKEVKTFIYIVKSYMIMKTLSEGYQMQDDTEPQNVLEELVESFNVSEGDDEEIYNSIEQITIESYNEYGEEIYEIHEYLSQSIMDIIKTDLVQGDDMYSEGPFSVPVFFDAIIDHYQQFEGVALTEAQETILQTYLRSARSIDDIMDYLDLNFILTDRDRLEDRMLDIEDSTMDVLEPQAPVSRQLDFSDSPPRESTPIPNSDTELEDDVNINEVVDKLKILMDELYEKDKEYYQEYTNVKLTKEQIEQKFYQYYSYANDPEVITTEFIRFIKDEYSVMYELASRSQRDEIEKRISEIVKSYDEFSIVDDDETDNIQSLTDAVSRIELLEPGV